MGDASSTRCAQTMLRHLQAGRRDNFPTLTPQPHHKPPTPTPPPHPPQLWAQTLSNADGGLQNGNGAAKSAATPSGLTDRLAKNDGGFIDIFGQSGRVLPYFRREIRHVGVQVCGVSFQTSDGDEKVKFSVSRNRETAQKGMPIWDRREILQGPMRRTVLLQVRKSMG